MKNPAEEMKARSSMSSTFGSAINTDMREDLKMSLEQIMQKKKPGEGSDSDDDAEVVSGLIICGEHKAYRRLKAGPPRHFALSFFHAQILELHLF